MYPHIYCNNEAAGPFRAAPLWRSGVLPCEVRLGTRPAALALGRAGDRFPASLCLGGFMAPRGEGSKESCVGSRARVLEVRSVWCTQAKALYGPCGPYGYCRTLQ